jgi:hypothetical protein
VTAGVTGRARRLLAGPGGDALGLWVASRIAAALLTLVGAWTLSGRAAGDVTPFLQRWQRWDANLFRKVAEHGYTGYPVDYPDRGIEGIFPGYPLLLRAVHEVVPLWTLSGLLISAVAGAWAVVALARLAELEGVPGQRAVLYLLVSPYAVFLAAAYSEALFLALALGGWLSARRGRWAAAGVLVALACAVRVNGLFLAVALLVQYAGQVGRPRRDALWLLLPVVPPVAYATYLYGLTGDPLRWLNAQEQGWGRQLTWPWQALSATLDLAADPRLRSDYSWAFASEVGAVAVGLVVTGVLLRRRRWAEAVYVGLSVGALATSSYYLSVNRATLLWFPLWLLLAGALAGRPRLHAAYLWTSAPLMAGLTLAYTGGRWVG